MRYNGENGMVIGASGFAQYEPDFADVAKVMARLDVYTRAENVDEWRGLRVDAPCEVDEGYVSFTAQVCVLAALAVDTWGDVVVDEDDLRSEVTSAVRDCDEDAEVEILEHWRVYRKIR